MKFALAALLIFVSGSAWAQGITNITPNGSGGFIVTEPFGDAGSMRNVTPNGAGGYTSTRPFGDARELENIQPDGAGGYVVTNPFDY
jgi:hypothetical protein